MAPQFLFIVVSSPCALCSGQLVARARVRSTLICALHSLLACHGPVIAFMQFEFNYSSLEKPHIQNDTVTLHRKAAKDHQVRLLVYRVCARLCACCKCARSRFGATGH